VSGTLRVCSGKTKAVKGVTGGFFFGLLAGIAAGVLISRVSRATQEDAESLSDRLSDVVGELESRIGALECGTYRAK